MHPFGGQTVIVVSTSGVTCSTCWRSPKGGRSKMISHGYRSNEKSADGELWWKVGPYRELAAFGVVDLVGCIGGAYSTCICFDWGTSDQRTL